MNHPKDVVIVQQLLNGHIQRDPCRKPLKVDGKWSPEFERAIATFQQLAGGPVITEGRMEPGTRMFEMLLQPPAIFGYERRMSKRMRNGSSDVDHLISIFKATVERMDKDGDRKPGKGDINGWKNNWLSGTNLEPKYLKCSDQAAEVMASLHLRSETTAKWTFTYEQRVPGPIAIHIWVKAQSDNPNDPVLHLDAWANEIRIIPAKPNR